MTALKYPEDQRYAKGTRCVPLVLKTSTIIQISAETANELKKRGLCMAIGRRHLRKKGVSAEQVTDVIKEIDHIGMRRILDQLPSFAMH